MGRGIASVSAAAGIQVRIFDPDRSAAEAAVLNIRSTGAPADRTDVRGVDDPAALTDADLIIEAVPERPEIKTSVLAGIEPALSPRVPVVSNSSSLSMTDLSRCLQTPQRFCGLHFCHPVSDRRLVEIVRAEATSEVILQTVRDYAVSLGKSPVIVPDTPGFVLNRLLVPYLNEALELLLEGVSVERLTQAAREFGLPTGPAEQLDEFGIDVALQVGSTLYRAFPDRVVPSELLIALYKSGRLGCKCGSGFHYDDGRFQADLTEDVRQIIDQRRRPAQAGTAESMPLRLFLPMLLEAGRMLSEQVADDVSVIDRVLGDGLGMTDRFRGLFGWAQIQGRSRLRAAAAELRALGGRFEVPPGFWKTVSPSGARSHHGGRAA